MQPRDVLGVVSDAANRAGLFALRGRPAALLCTFNGTGRNAGQRRGVDDL
jgi:hypothetical protein